MSHKISPEVMEKAEAPEGKHREIPVIVTLAPGADPATLESKGIIIRRIMENIPAIAGTVTGAAVSELAQLDEVERVELDGEMHAL
jgi:hypothetical protein